MAEQALLNNIRYLKLFMDKDKCIAYRTYIFINFYQEGKDLSFFCCDFTPKSYFLKVKRRYDSPLNKGRPTCLLNTMLMIAS